jgi:hypothetical protein
MERRATALPTMAVIDKTFRESDIMANIAERSEY